jgi:hypothetical protein
VPVPDEPDDEEPAALVAPAPTRLLSSWVVAAESDEPVEEDVVTWVGSLEAGALTEVVPPVVSLVVTAVAVGSLVVEPPAVAVTSLTPTATASPATLAVLGEISSGAADSRVEKPPAAPTVWAAAVGAGAASAAVEASALGVEVRASAAATEPLRKRPPLNVITSVPPGPARTIGPGDDDEVTITSDAEGPAKRRLTLPPNEIGPLTDVVAEPDSTFAVTPEIDALTATSSRPPAATTRSAVGDAWSIAAARSTPTVDATSSTGVCTPSVAASASSWRPSTPPRDSGTALWTQPGPAAQLAASSRFWTRCT